MRPGLHAFDCSFTTCQNRSCVGTMRLAISYNLPIFADFCESAKQERPLLRSAYDSGKTPAIHSFSGPPQSVRGRIQAAIQAGDPSIDGLFWSAWRLAGRSHYVRDLPLKLFAGGIKVQNCDFFSSLPSGRGSLEREKGGGTCVKNITPP